MIIYNGKKYISEENNALSKIECTRQQYDSLTPENNVIYIIKETNNNTTIYFNGQQWNGTIDFPIAVEEVNLLAAKHKSQSIGLMWVDPNDVKDDSGNIIVGWKKTVVVRKQGSFPEGPEDGTIVVTETTRNTYSKNYFYDNGLINDTTYYYAIFTQSTTNTWSVGIRFTETPQLGQVNPPQDLQATFKSGNLVVTWKAPKINEETDTAFGVTLDHYILVYNNDHMPRTALDGVAMDISSSFINKTIKGLEEGTYYVALYAVSNEGGYSPATTDTDSLVSYKIMTVRIDETNSNPETALEYMDDAIEMEAGSEAWDEWFGCYPVILATDGTEIGTLNKDDYTKFEDGTDASSYLSSGEYDVMIAFPILGYKLNREGNYLYVSMTKNPNAKSNGFVYYAHTKGTTKKKKFYLGAYKAYNNSSKLYSWSGKTPTTSITLTDARSYATARGTGYQLSAFYQRIFVQCMYILKYKNLNSQATLGQGYVNGSSAQTTGATNANGFSYGSSSVTSRVKLFGLEDFWGNIWEWMDGCYFGSSSTFYTDPTNSKFNDSDSNYVNAGTWASSGYISKAIGTSLGGFIGATNGGSTSTYYADYCDTYSGSCLIAGGAWNYTDAAGAFFVGYFPASSPYSTVGCRICYL